MKNIDPSPPIPHFWNWQWLAIRAQLQYSIAAQSIHECVCAREKLYRRRWRSGARGGRRGRRSRRGASSAWRRSPPRKRPTRPVPAVGSAAAARRAAARGGLWKGTRECGRRGRIQPALGSSPPSPSPCTLNPSLLLLDSSSLCGPRMGRATMLIRSVSSDRLSCGSGFLWRFASLQVRA